MNQDETIKFLQHILDNDPNVDMFNALIENSLKNTQEILPIKLLYVIQHLEEHYQKKLDADSQQIFDKLFCEWVQGSQECFDILTGCYRSTLPEISLKLIFNNPDLFSKIDCSKFLKPYDLHNQDDQEFNLWNLIRLIQYQDTQQYNFSSVLSHIYSSSTFQYILDNDVPHRETFLWSVARDDSRSEHFFNTFKHKISDTWFCDYFEYLCTKNPEQVPTVLQDTNVQKWIENNLSLYPIIYNNLEVNHNNIDTLQTLLPEKYHFMLQQNQFYSAMHKRDISQCIALWNNALPIDKNALYYNVAQRVLDFPDITFMEEDTFLKASEEFFQQLSPTDLLMLYNDPLHTKYIDFLEPFALQQFFLTDHISDHIQTTETCRKRKI